MPASPGAITRPSSSPEAAVAAHRGGPLVVLGGAGAGGRRRWWRASRALVASGVTPEEIVLLTRGAPAAEALRTRVEDALGDRPFEELPVMPIHGMCARLLRDEALEAGVDPFAVTATPADRLALLLDRVDELTLRHHDLRGRPAAVLGALIARIDRLKDAGVRRGGSASGRRGSRPRTCRTAPSASASSRGSTRPTIVCCWSRGCWTSASWCCGWCELLEQRPHVRGAGRGALAPRACLMILRI